MAFTSTKDVDNWLARPGHTISFLRTQVASGNMSGDNARWAKIWLDEYEAMADNGRANREFELMERSVKAAERQAAKASWAIWISIAALFLSAWPFIAIRL